MVEIGKHWIVIAVIWNLFVSMFSCFTGGVNDNVLYECYNIVPLHVYKIHNTEIPRKIRKFMLICPI